MFERFTDRARNVMALANQEAHRLSHDYIGPEHILLGLVERDSGVGANILKNLDVDLHRARLLVEKHVQSGAGVAAIGKLPLTSAAKRVIENAIAEARMLNHNYVGTEHLLLGLLREPDGIVARVFESLRLALEGVRQETADLLGALPDLRSCATPDTRPETVQRFEDHVLAGQLQALLEKARSQEDRHFRDAKHEDATRFRELANSLSVALMHLRAVLAVDPDFGR